ncbi:MAG TPA: TetR/AcrR family transcriptional regulator [Actinobacteria bacterium]|nr:TetR/AcrR family transcriptional regulator [Actinomycetota bacterium]
MSPRKPAVLRNSDGPNLREHLIATAARLIDERGSAGLAVRDIAREAQVADGVLYNYFEDKEDLLAHALLAHVASVMGNMPQMLPPAGTGTVAENLSSFIERGLEVLGRVTPAFAGLLAQPKVLTRFHGMVGGGAAFGIEPADHAAAGAEAPGPRGLPDMLTAYLLAEQRLGRIGETADVGAASTLIIGVIHGEVLPRLVFSPPGTPQAMPPGLAGRLAQAVLDGIAPRTP